MLSPKCFRHSFLLLLVILFCKTHFAQVSAYCDISPINEVVGERTLIYPCDTPFVTLSYEAVSLDSNFVAVGYPEINQVYIYEMIAGAWKTNSILQAADTDEGDLFGHHLSLKGDRLLVAAPKADGFESESGACYLFYFNGVEWIEGGKVVASDGQTGDEFGDELILEDTLIFVAAPKAEGKLGQPEGGAVYMYVYSSGSYQERKIQYTNAYLFGFGMAYDNGWLAVSRQLAFSPGSMTGVGKSQVNLYQLDGLKKPILNQTIQIPNSKPESRRYGATMRMKNGWLLIGSSAEREGIDVYKYNGVEWEKELMSTISGGPQLFAGLHFDFDGETIIQYYRKFNVWHNTGSGFWRNYRFSTGTIRSFKYDGISWKLDKQLTHLDSFAIGSSPEFRNTFGKALAIEGDQVIATEGGGYSLWWGSETYSARAQIFQLSQVENVPDSMDVLARVESSFSTAGFSVFPNPTTSKITLTSTIEQHAKPQIFDLLGREIDIPIAKRNSFTWYADLGELGEGTYIIRLDGQYRMVVRQ